jgi:hypothetical protein
MPHVSYLDKHIGGLHHQFKEKVQYLLQGTSFFFFLVPGYLHKEQLLKREGSGLEHEDPIVHLSITRENSLT